MFADKENFKLPTCVSPTRDPQAFAVDALSLDWKDMFAYAFPPPKLLTKVVHKIQSTPCRLILVTPYWPVMPWFSTVAGLAVKPPIRLTIHPNLLNQILGNGRRVFHNNPESLRLHAWLLSGNPLNS